MKKQLQCAVHLVLKKKNNITSHFKFPPMTASGAKKPFSHHTCEFQANLMIRTTGLY